MSKICYYLNVIPVPFGILISLTCLWKSIRCSEVPFLWTSSRGCQHQWSVRGKSPVTEQLLCIHFGTENSDASRPCSGWPLSFSPAFWVLCHCTPLGDFSETLFMRCNSHCEDSGPFAVTVFVIVAISHGLSPFERLSQSHSGPVFVSLDAEMLASSLPEGSSLFVIPVFWLVPTLSLKGECQEYLSWMLPRVPFLKSTMFPQIYILTTKSSYSNENSKK